MLDYTYQGEIVRGGRWPAADDVITVALTKSSGWPVGADGWTWNLTLSQEIKGGTPDLVLTSESEAIVGLVLTLTFSATVAQTTALPVPSRGQFNVDIKSTNGAVVSYYDGAQGFASVRDPVGEG